MHMYWAEHPSPCLDKNSLLGEGESRETKQTESTFKPQGDTRSLQRQGTKWMRNRTQRSRDLCAVTPGSCFHLVRSVHQQYRVIPFLSNRSKAFLYRKTMLSSSNTSLLKITPLLRAQSIISFQGLRTPRGVGMVWKGECLQWPKWS